MLKDTMNLMNSNQLFSDKVFEVIMINDGSKDSTWELIQDQVKLYQNNIMIGINYSKNGGKGFAVRSGMRSAKGDFVLMIDADGATDVNEISRFYNLMQDSSKKSKYTIIIGSRNCIDESKEANRPLLRKLPSLVNNFFVRKLIGIKSIKDTQCGFKIFTQEAKTFLFSLMHLNRWAFDIELLYLAQKNNFTIIESSINWKEMAGGSLSMLSAPITFFRDYFGILTFYNLNIWKATK